MTGVLANKLELYDGGFGRPRSYTVLAGTQISKGMTLMLSDPRTAAEASGSILMGALGGAQTGFPAGIAAMDKTTDLVDTSSQITAWTCGVFDMVASGTITVGEPVIFVADGRVSRFPIGVLGGSANSWGFVAGRALETATDAERIEVFVNV